MADHGGVWEIDHIIPISWFDMENESHIKLINNYLNLRPLDTATNRAKRDSLPPTIPHDLVKFCNETLPEGDAILSIVNQHPHADRKMPAFVLSA